MNRNLYLLPIIFLFSDAGMRCPLAAQTPAGTFRLVSALTVQAHYATTDNLGNVYLVTPQNALEKYAPDGRLLGRYSNSRLGPAAWIDTSNPLKILVWYGEFRTAVFLDRNMAALGEFNLIAAGFPEVRNLTMAADGNLWLYDETAFQLLKITPSGDRLFESQRLNQLHPGRTHITCLRDNGNEVLASDPETGVFWFDAYGQLVKFLPWKNIDSFVLRADRLEYLLEGALCREQLRTFASERLPLPPSARLHPALTWLSPQGYLLVQNGAVLEQWQWQEQ